MAMAVDSEFGDGEGEVCRVCREGSDAAPLFHPCRCTGSIRWVHEECLQSWLEHSGKSRCELCGQDFRFARVYDPAMPAAISTVDFVTGLFKVAQTELHSWGRVVLVGFCWGIIFPVVARWTWQVLFGEWTFPWEHDDPMARLGWDCLQGLCIAGAVFCLTMGALGLRDFMQVNGIPLRDPLEMLEAIDGRAVGDDHAAAAAAAAGNHGGNVAAGAGEGHPAAANIVNEVPAADHEDHREIDEELDAAIADFLNEWDDVDAVDDEEIHEHHEDNVIGWDAWEPEWEPPNLGHLEDDEEDVDLIPPPDGVEEPAEEHAVEGAIELHPNDDMPLEELVGLVGPWHAMLDNLVWIVVINAAVVFLFAKMPALLGEAVSVLAGAEVEAAWVHMLLGYTVLTAYAVMHLSLPGGWLPGHMRFGDTLFARCITFACLFIKVCALLVCEIVVCPLLCGWWLDICSLELQQSSLRAHVALVKYAPWTSTFLHWFIGTLFMHNFAAFVAVCRSVVHPRVLWFFRDPDDPNFHPLKQMLELPIVKYGRRLVIINVLYGVLVLLLVWLPVKTLCRLFPEFMPYRFLVTHPLEMLLFTFGLPLAQSYGELGDLCTFYVSQWIQAVAALLGITNFMLGDGTPEQDPLTAFDRPPFFRARVAVFLFFGWLTAYCIITSWLSAPVWLGRSVFAKLTTAPVHDFYSFLVGTCVYWALASVASVDVRGAIAALQRAVSYDGMVKLGGHVTSVLRSLYFGLVALGLFPLALGLVVDLAIVTPLTCPVNMTPSTTLWQDWGLGIMLCKAVYEVEADWPAAVVWYRHEVRDQLEGRPDTYTIATTTRLFGPMLLLLGVILAVPYVVAYGHLGQELLGVRGALEVYRLAFPIGFAFVMARGARGTLKQATGSIYQAIVDEKYLIGRRLINVDEDTTQGHYVYDTDDEL